MACPWRGLSVPASNADAHRATLEISWFACTLARPAAGMDAAAEQAAFHCRSKVTSRSVSVVSTTKMASRLAGSVALAFSLMG